MTIYKFNDKYFQNGCPTSNVLSLIVDIGDGSTKAFHFDNFPMGLTARLFQEPNTFFVRYKVDSEQECHEIFNILNEANNKLKALKVQPMVKIDTNDIIFQGATCSIGD